MRAKDLAVSYLAEVEKLEYTAERSQKERIRLTPDQARAVGAIWVLSGPGAYVTASKADRYEKKSWAQWMDRRRLNHAVRLMRSIAESLGGLSPTGMGNVKERKHEIEGILRDEGPFLIYNGRPDETAVAMQVLEQGDVMVPKERVLMQGGERIDKSIDQVKYLEIPPQLIQDGKELIVVSHAAHLPRILRMLAARGDFPRITIRAFPLPTPVSGRKEYTREEIAATVYYALVAKPPIAQEASYPYTVGF